MNSIIRKLFITLFLLAPLWVSAQDVRTVKTTVADVLALLPANNNQLAGKLFHELLVTGDEGLGLVMDQLRPNGDPAGIPARYAVSLLTHYATTAAEKATIERVYLSALDRTSQSEIKAYLISNIKLIGSDAAIPVLAAFIPDKDLYDPAIEALVTFGTQKAGEVMLKALPGATPVIQARLIKAMGEMKFQSASFNLTEYALSGDNEIRKQALWSLAVLGNADAYAILKQQAEKSRYRRDPAEAIEALLEFQRQLALAGNSAVVKSINGSVLSNTPDSLQRHFRLSSLTSLAMVDKKEATNWLIKERLNPSAGYRKQVLNTATSVVWDDAIDQLWIKEYKKTTGQQQAELLSMLASVHPDGAFTTAYLIPLLSSKDKLLRMTAAREVGSRRDKKYLQPLAGYLVKAGDDEEIRAAQKALLQVADKDNCATLIAALTAAPPKNKAAILEIFSERRAVSTFDAVVEWCNSKDAFIRAKAYESLAAVSTGPRLDVLLTMLTATNDAGEIKSLQSAIIAILPEADASRIHSAYAQEKIKLLPVLGFLPDKEALADVTAAFQHGTAQEKDIAFNTLCHWGNQDAVRTLLNIIKNPDLSAYQARAFASYISMVTKSNWPDDEKLLMLREVMNAAGASEDKIMVLRAIGGLRSFLALVFVGEYLDDPALAASASRAAMQIALPTADARPGLTGTVVQNTLQKALKTLTGPDSQYERIDITTYLDKLPHTKGFEPIFNGKDLTGWHGLVENPIARAKMTKEELAAKQQAADATLGKSWSVKDGAIWFTGDGGNLCTTLMYGDFEMIVDWKISKDGDSGIYLRGSPQVQIWDNARTDVGAEVGSGGLYNNQKGISKPLVVADNPVGEWNTFRITMVGERVTVYLNGVLVVDNVVMENYWDRNIPIFPEEALELQAHGTELAFRNIYVKELGHKPVVLSMTEQEEGFQLLFNGKDLNNWVGNKTDYVVEDTDIAVYPKEGNHGNLYTEKEYSNFIFRFEFQLTPGANNGIGIHAPLEGDAAYVGKEIQVIDNTAPMYANIEQYQFHGSVYGIIPARHGFLRPVGEWNEEEILVKGDYIKVTLNGTVITEGNVKKASRKGTMDHKDHPGLNRHTGHIGFLGHGSDVKFRNIRIKELPK